MVAPTEIQMTRDETTTEEKSSRSYWGFVLWPLAATVLYVLSYGPASVAYKKGMIGDNAAIVYRPLLFTLNAADLWRPFGVYMHLWRPDQFHKDGTMVTID